MSVHSADAVWKGPLTTGKGHLKTESGKLDTDYEWKSRAEDGKGTNPEELIAAAHAGCFSMALSHMLTGAGFPPDELNTKAAVTFDKVGDGFGITGIKLTLSARIPKIDDAKFKELTEKAKAGCPVSKALSAVPISLDATLAK